MKFPHSVSYEFPVLFPSNKGTHWGVLFQTRFERNRSTIPYMRQSSRNELVFPSQESSNRDKIVEILSPFNEFRSFNANFLRKEALYSKLRYSRTPSFDIVSGGSALLLTSFLGYLICDKTGFELIDSGDFMFLIVYLTAVLFALKTTLKLYTNTSRQWNIFNFRLWLRFYSNFTRFASITILSIFRNK